MEIDGQAQDSDSTSLGQKEKSQKLFSKVAWVLPFFALSSDCSKPLIPRSPIQLCGLSSDQVRHISVFFPPEEHHSSQSHPFRRVKCRLSDGNIPSGPGEACTRCTRLQVPCEYKSSTRRGRKPKSLLEAERAAAKEEQDQLADTMDHRKSRPFLCFRHPPCIETLMMRSQANAQCRMHLPIQKMDFRRLSHRPHDFLLFQQAMASSRLRSLKVIHGWLCILLNLYILRHYRILLLLQLLDHFSSLCITQWLNFPLLLLRSWNLDVPSRLPHKLRRSVNIQELPRRFDLPLLRLHQILPPFVFTNRPQNLSPMQLSPKHLPSEPQTCQRTRSISSSRLLLIRILSTCTFLARSKRHNYSSYSTLDWIASLSCSIRSCIPPNSVSSLWLRPQFLLISSCRDVSSQEFNRSLHRYPSCIRQVLPQRSVPVTSALRSTARRSRHGRRNKSSYRSHSSMSSPSLLERTSRCVAISSFNPHASDPFLSLTDDSAWIRTGEFDLLAPRRHPYLRSRFIGFALRCAYQLGLHVKRKVPLPEDEFEARLILDRER